MFQSPVPSTPDAGWVVPNYVEDWVYKKIRRHLMRSRKRHGFGWKRWSRDWIYAETGVFNDYYVKRT